jgi:hypothetical protein
MEKLRMHMSLTTMYIASSEFIQFLKNDINLPETYPNYLVKMKANKRHHRIIWLAWILIPIFVAAIVLTISRLAGSEAIWSIVSAAISGIVTALIE